MGPPLPDGPLYCIQYLHDSKNLTLEEPPAISGKIHLYNPTIFSVWIPYPPYKFHYLEERPRFEAQSGIRSLCEQSHHNIFEGADNALEPVLPKLG